MGHLLHPFVSSLVETPIGRARLHGLSTEIKATGWGKCSV